MLGSVVKTQIIEKEISTQLPQAKTECMENDSLVLVEIQIGKEGPSHTKEIAEQIGFPFKHFRPKT